MVSHSTDIPLHRHPTPQTSHSTDIHVPLNINQSPFNVGLPVQLSPLTTEQVQELAKRHELLPFSPDELEQLM